MKKIAIKKLQNNGTQKTVATCELVGNVVNCQGLPAFVENLSNIGIVDYDSSNRERLFPKDGEKFLRQLLKNFDSVYLNAQEETI